MKITLKHLRDQFTLWEQSIQNLFLGDIAYSSADPEIEALGKNIIDTWENIHHDARAYLNTYFEQCLQLDLDCWERFRKAKINPKFLL